MIYVGSWACECGHDAETLLEIPGPSRSAPLCPSCANPMRLEETRLHTPSEVERVSTASVGPTDTLFVFVSRPLDNAAQTRLVEHFWGLGFERVAVAEPSIEGFAVIKREPTS